MENKKLLEIKRKRYYGLTFRCKSHGITIEEHHNMLIEQNWCCAICGQPETKVQNGIVQQLSIDHCHKTKKVRGLLCNRCNHLLGFVKDNPDILLNASEYLKKHNK